MLTVRTGSVLWLPLAILFGIFCTVLYCLPGPELPSVKLFDGVDKVVHAGLFIGLTLLWLAAAKAGCWQTSVFKMAVFLSLYGLLIELVQWQWIVGRAGDWLDWLVDTIGIMLGVWLFPLLFRLRK